MFIGLTGQTIQGARKPFGATLGVYAFAFNSSTVEFTVSKTKAPSYTRYRYTFFPLGARFNTLSGTQPFRRIHDT